MRWISAFIAALIVLVGLSYGRLGTPAFAVMNEPVPARPTVVSAASAPKSAGPISPVVLVPPTLSPSPKATPDDGLGARTTQQPMHIDLPVSWQLTRTRLLGPGATTLTESFHETWTLELLANGLYNLRSPRAKVAAYAPAGSATGSSGGLVKNSASSNPSRPSLPGERTPADPLVADIPKLLVVGERDFARLIGVETGPEDDTGAEPKHGGGTPITIQLTRATKGGSDINLNWSEEQHVAVHLEVGGTSTLF